MSNDPLHQLSESVALLEQATEGNQTQIQELAQNMNKAVADLATNSARQIREVTVLVERQGNEFRSEMKTMAASFGAENRALANDFANSKQPNYLLWISGFMALAVLVGAAYKIVDLQTQVTMTPILSKAIANEAGINSLMGQYSAMRTDAAQLRSDLDTNVARDQVSEKDRTKLNERADRTDEHLAKLETDNKVIENSQAEIETQIAKNYDERNIQNAQFERKLIEIQSALHALGAVMPELPQEPYYQPAPSRPVKK